MKNELDYALSRLDNAYLKLKEGAESARDELGKDGVIQRFEFTFELLWKTIKIFLSNSGIEAKTPKDALKEAFRLDWLSEENVFLDMLEDRNRTTHIYSKKASEEIFERIRDNYEPAVAKVVKKLESVLKKQNQ